MHGADGVVDGVVQENNAAVSGKDRQGNAGGVADHGVHAGVVPFTPQALAGIIGGNQPDVVLVHLAAEHSLPDIRADGGTEAAIVFLQAALSVTAAGAQIQTVPRRRADAAGPGGKTVDQTGLGK